MMIDWTKKASMTYCNKLNELVVKLDQGILTPGEFADQKAYADACYQRRIQDINERLELVS